MCCSGWFYLPRIQCQGGLKLGGMSGLLATWIFARNFRRCSDLRCDKILFWTFARNFCRCSDIRCDKILFWTFARNFCRCAARRCEKIQFCVRHCLTSHFFDTSFNNPTSLLLLLLILSFWSLFEFMLVGSLLLVGLGFGSYKFWE